MVVRHVGATDWERISFTDELDLIGPVAQTVLRRWGPCFPFNAHFGLPTFPLARHGCYVTGIGGDEIFQLSERNHLGALLAGRERSSAPPSSHRRPGPAPRRRPLPPLRAGHARPGVAQAGDAGDEFKRRMADDHARQPIWNARDLLDDFWRDRGRLALTSTLASLRRFLRDGARAPLRRPPVPLGRGPARPRTGWLRREDAMRELFGDLLPDPLILRRSKARFSHPFFSTFSRSFRGDLVRSGSRRRARRQRPVAGDVETAGGRRPQLQPRPSCVVRVCHNSLKRGEHYAGPGSLARLDQL